VASFESGDVQGPVAQGKGVDRPGPAAWLLAFGRPPGLDERGGAGRQPPDGAGPRLAGGGPGGGLLLAGPGAPFGAGRREHRDRRAGGQGAGFHGNSACGSSPPDPAQSRKSRCLRHGLSLGRRGSDRLEGDAAGDRRHRAAPGRRRIRHPREARKRPRDCPRGGHVAAFPRAPRPSRPAEEKRSAASSGTG